MPRILILPTMLLLASQAGAATLSSTQSFSGQALIYDPATDYSPSTANGGYLPPTQLGGYDGLLTFSGFDTSLGTLNVVTISEHAESSLRFTDAFAIYGTPGVINVSLYVSGQDPYGSAGFSMPYTFDVPVTMYPTTYDTGFQFNSAGPASYSTNLPLTFGPFYDPLIYVPILAYGVLGASSASYFTDITSSYTYTMTIAYDYTPSAVVSPTNPIPEPGPAGLISAGIGMLAVIHRRGCGGPPATVGVRPLRRRNWNAVYG